MADAQKEELRQKIFGKIKEYNLASMATITEDGKPWVRYVTPIGDESFNLWIATSLESRKAGQIKANPEVHLTTGVTSPESAESYLQIQGKAEILTDQDTKKKMWVEQLGAIFKGPDDPIYCVLKITPYRIEFQSLGMMPPEVWEP